VTKLIDFSPIHLLALCVHYFRIPIEIDRNQSVLVVKVRSRNAANARSSGPLSAAFKFESRRIWSFIV